MTSLWPVDFSNCEAISLSGPAMPPPAMTWTSAAKDGGATQNVEPASRTALHAFIYIAHRPSSGVLFALLHRIPKIAVTGALHDGLRHGEPHIGTKTFCMEKIRIRATSQQE